MLNRPNPLVLVMGGGSLFTCSLFIAEAHVAAWIRYGGMVALMVLGVTSIALGLHMAFKKKPAPEPKKRKMRDVTLGPGASDTGSRRASADDRSSRPGS